MNPVRKNAFDIMMKASRSRTLSNSHSVHVNDIPKYDFKLQFDGGSRGNPGVSGCGSVIFKNNNEMWNVHKFIGTDKTNNEAEYMGLLYGIKGCIELGIDELLIQGDSQIIINQIKGDFKVNSPKLKPYHTCIMDLLKKNIKSYHIEYIPRSDNSRADELANLAMDEYKG